MFEALQELLVGKLNRAHVDMHRAFDAATAGITHAAPVLKGIRKQGVVRNRGNGLIEILNFYRGE